MTSQLDYTPSYLQATMNLFRPLLRGLPVRSPIYKQSIIIPIRTRLFTPTTSHIFHARPVASSVSGRPGSQTLEHAATNVKEELGNSASDLAKVIAGANVTEDAISTSGEASFVSAGAFSCECRGLTLRF